MLATTFTNTTSSVHSMTNTHFMSRVYHRYLPTSHTRSEQYFESDSDESNSADKAASCIINRFFVNPICSSLFKSRS